MGVSVLGAVLAHQVSTKITDGLTRLGIDPAAYGEATGHIFLTSAGIAVVGVIASLFLTPTKLRGSVDL